MFLLIKKCLKIHFLDITKTQRRKSERYQNISEEEK